MRNEILFAGAVLAAALAVASPAAATVTFEEARFTGEANAYARYDPDRVTLTADDLPAAPLVQNRSSYASAHGSSARAQASASFNSAYDGLLTLTELYAGSRWFEELPSGASASANLRYDFTVDRSYLARFTYDLDLDPDTYVGFYIFKDGALLSSGDLDGQGFSFSDAFGPGAYSLRIESESTAQSGPTLSEEYSTAKGTVGFTLLPNGRDPSSPTPEPATWALMIAGFGMAGAGLRRRRVVAQG